ncbi:MAG: cysteine desulfurase NifS [bacterium]|jgi:cysteine desulfurase
MRHVYLDHAATTPVHPEVAGIMGTYMLEHYGNPSSIHAYGRKARQAMETARENVARLIAADSEEIVFTGGGTEADNYALKGTAWANRDKGNHIITSQIEHHAVLHSCEYLEEDGFEVTFLPVDADGMVSPAAVEEAMRPNTILVSVMLGNNEVGTVQPIKEIAEIVHRHGAICHTDAVQAVGNYPVDIGDLGVDLLSLSGHKFYAPKGIGALYIKKGTRIIPIQHGGGHERGRRAGTENIPGIVGIGKAAEIAWKELPERVAHLTALRNKLIGGLQARIDHLRLNGHPERRLPGNVNVSIEYVEGESLLLNLDMKGIAASSGSACTSGSLDPSHVLLAMGMPHDIAHGSLRMTLGRSNTVEHIDYVLDVLPEIVSRLRAMSPLVR